MASKSRILYLSLIVVALLGALALTFTAQADFGTGWTGEYFANENLQPPVVYTEAAPNGINYNWGTGSPNPAVPVDFFSARFTSIQNFNQGVYEFVIVSDDGMRLFIDNVLVIDRFVGRPQTTDRVQVSLTPGAHTLVLEYFEGIDLALVQLQYFQVSGGTPTVVGGGGVVPTQFVTPVATPIYSGPLATVSGANGLALRTGPFLGASFITTLPGGTSYPVLARNFEEGVYNWYLLQVGERQGWASGRFLQLNVEPLSLPTQGSIFDQIDNAPDRNAFAIPRAVMNLRARPSERSPIIGSIPWGDVTSLIGRTVQAGINRWYQVRYNGMVGWIAAPWVTINGEIYSVPIR